MTQARVELLADSRQVRRATDDLERLESRGKSTTTATTALRNAFVALGGALSVRAVVRYADAYTSVQNQLKIVTESTSELANIQRELLEVANNTRSELESTAGLYATLARNTTELNISQDRLVRITDIINKSFAASGATAQEAAGAIRQLSQGLAAGALRGDEFNSVAEGAPEILRAVAAETGKTIGELREFAAEGQITSELLIRSLENYGDTIDDIFDKSERTFGQSLTVANNNLTTFLGKANQSSGAISLLGDVIVDLSENLSDFDDSARAAFEGIIRGGAFVGDAFRGIELGLLSAELAFRTAEQVALSFAVSVQQAFIEIEKSVTANINAIIERYNALPFLDDIPKLEFDTSQVPSLRQSLDEASQDVANTRLELVRLANEPLPTDSADAYLNNLKEKANEAKIALNEIPLGEPSGLFGGFQGGQQGGDNGIDDESVRSDFEKLQGDIAKEGLTVQPQITGDMSQGEAAAERVRAETQTELALLEQRYMERTNIINQYRQTENANIQEANEAQLELTQQFEDQKTAIQEQASAERRRIAEQEQEQQNQSMMKSLDYLGQAFGNFAEIAKQGGKESFERYKDLATAQALISTFQATANALATPGVPWPVAVAFSVSAAAMGAAQVSAIQGQQYSPRAAGGQVLAGNEYLVGERGPEIVRMNTNGSVMPNSQLRNEMNTTNNNEQREMKAEFNFNLPPSEQGLTQWATRNRDLFYNLVASVADDRGMRLGGSR
ncbi:MAG: putative tail tape measure protein [Prokaryotic dsDNA virus sp.]|jgi:tape measure domain-containing protein|nr:MAG: putative tail tape measure protein [Prokaryotic dsDNA virus sp.]|tara:strand:- start:24380 stop:26584 length:2205 start_codon:yes stop_codon:yes gene_type:complete